MAAVRHFPLLFLLIVLLPLVVLCMRVLQVQAQLEHWKSPDVRIRELALYGCAQDESYKFLMKVS